MTTKMTATRGDAAMRCCVVLLLLLLGVPSGQAQCVQKITECNTLLINIGTELTPVFTPPYNATALDTACRSVRQNMTDCVREANESCSGQPDMLGPLGSLANSSTSLDFYCGPALICQLKATACQAAILAVLPTGPPSGTESETTGGVDMLQKLCPLYEQAAQCLQNLTATDQCSEVEAVENVTSIFAMSASSCAAVTGGQACPQSLGCFSAFMSATQSAGQCSAMQTYVGCLSGLKGTCTFDESKITLTDLQSLMTSVCTETLKYPAEYGNCSAVVQCRMTSPTLGLSALTSVNSTDSQEVLTIMTKLTDPAFLCSYLQVMVDCSVSQAQACQYNNQYVAFMKTQQQSLQPRCSKSGQNTGDGSATGVPSGQTQCIQKMTECSTLRSNIGTELAPLLTPPYNATARETACSSVRQTMTDCVREANEACSGQPDMLGSLTNLLTSLDSFCGPALICQLKATACQAAMLEVLPTGPPSGTESETTGGVDMLQKLCPLYEQASQCLQALTATDQCREVDAVKNMTSAIAMAASGCAAVTGGQACPQSFACFSAFKPAAESAGQCSAMQTYVGCLKGGTCTFDESKITLTDLQSLMTSVCTETLKYPAEYQNCSALVQCGMTSPTGLGLSALTSGDSPDTELLTIMTKLTDPAFLCSYLQVMVDCSVSQAQACQYNDQYVAFMKTQQQSLQPRCSKAGQNTGDGSATDDGSAGERSSGHAMHWVLTAVTSLTAALLFGL